MSLESLNGSRTSTRDDLPPITPWISVAWLGHPALSKKRLRTRPMTEEEMDADDVAEAERRLADPLERILPFKPSR